MDTRTEAGRGRATQFRPSPGHPFCSKRPGLQVHKGPWGQGSPPVQIVERAAKAGVGGKRQGDQGRKRTQEVPPGELTPHHL